VREKPELSRFRGALSLCAALAVVPSCSDDDAAPAAAAGSGGAPLDGSAGSDAGASGGSSGSGGSGGSAGNGAASGAGGALATGGAAPGDASAGSSGTAGMSSGPAIRGSTETPCLEHSQCPSGVCVGNYCDGPGCGPTPGITEVCDGKDNDCDAIADNPGTCDGICRGSILDGRTYMFCDSVKTFADAEASCRSKGMHLLRLDSAAEQQLVNAEAARLSVTPGWIGGFARDEDGVWRWIGGEVFWRGGADGAPEAGRFTSWGTGQPNDGGQNHEQRCLRAFGSWNDWECGIRLPYICELYSVAAGCFDAVKNGSETGTDCGGSCNPCPTGEACGGSADCQSQSCVAGMCADTCRDGVQNGSETAVDCGGHCRRCASGRTCGDATDCGSRLCSGGTCGACVTSTCPECDDGYRCCSMEGHCGCKGLTTQICLGGARP
jgi:hypothetical protein